MGEYEYQPFVAMLLHGKTGCRTFVECSGISTYYNSVGVHLGSGTRYVIFKNKKITLREYQEEIINSLPQFKLDLYRHPEAFIFEFLKIGPDWASKQKRLELITRLSKSHAALVYDYSKYGNKRYTSSDIIKAKKLCVSSGNSNISLREPVHIGWYSDVEPEFQNKTYKNAGQASRFTGLSIEKLLYRFFTADSGGFYRDWFLLSSRKYHTLNARYLNSMNIEKASGYWLAENVATQRLA